MCAPLYTILSESFPWVSPLLDGALSNRSRWADLDDKVKMGLTWIDHDIIEVPVEDVEVNINGWSKIVKTDICYIIRPER